MTEFAVAIPARYASQRLPGKPLREIGGRTMLEHAWRAATTSGASEVVIVTDDERVADAAESFGALACMTSPDHASGTDRIAEAADILDWQDEQIVVNLQGDEPFMPPELVRQCASLLADERADLSTLASPLADDVDLADPNVVKALCDDEGFAIYFSRAPIPFSRSADTDDLARGTALHHHGIYGYRVSVLRRLVATPQAAAERCERLEQLRALALGLKIKVGIPDARPGPGVDTEEDLRVAEKFLAANAAGT